MRKDISESLVDRWLVYLANWVVRFMLAPVRLVNVTLYYAVTWERLVKNPIYQSVYWLLICPGAMSMGDL